MGENRYDGIFGELEQMAQKYALAKSVRHKLKAQILELKEELSSEGTAQKVHREKKSAFYQGFLAALVLAALVYLVVKGWNILIIRRF
jgi:hypothetical protein